MRATKAFEIATYLALGVIAALFVTLSMLSLHMVRAVESHSAEIDHAYASMVGTAHLAAELAEIQRDECQAPWPSVPVGNAFTAAGFAPFSRPGIDDGIPSSARSGLPSSNERGLVGPAWRAEHQCLNEMVRTLRPQEARSVTLAARGMTSLPIAMAELADQAPTIGELNSLIDGLVHRQSLDVERGKLRESAGFRQLRDDAVLIGVIAMVPGLLLLGLIRRSFAAQEEVTGELAFTNEHLEHKVRERTAQLQAANEALSQHSARIEAAREEERLRIARDVHDELGSTLTALKLELSGTLGSKPIPGARVPRARRAATDMVDAALKSVQDVIAALRPFPLEQLGLWEALRWKTGQFEQLMGVSCHLTMAEPLPRVSPAVSIAAFRIVEEALTNVARHAGASAAEVIARQENGRLVLTVSDNGRGIRGAELLEPCSFGLMSMRERARSVRGEVTIDARAAGGTTVRASLPAEPG